VYGDPATEKPLHLYARSITLPLYPGRPPLQITAPVPRHMVAALRNLGFVEAVTA
jgi:tRNA pseudouridine32 synthase/23S rRNA pseudouridine746 synthase